MACLALVQPELVPSEAPLDQELGGLALGHLGKICLLMFGDDLG